jgi:hypothetical protein
VTHIQQKGRRGGVSECTPKQTSARVHGCMSRWQPQQALPSIACVCGEVWCAPAMLCAMRAGTASSSAAAAATSTAARPRRVVTPRARGGCAHTRGGCALKRAGAARGAICCVSVGCSMFVVGRGSVAPRVARRPRAPARASAARAAGYGARVGVVVVRRARGGRHFCWWLDPATLGHHGHTRAQSSYRSSVLPRLLERRAASPAAGNCTPPRPHAMSARTTRAAAAARTHQASDASWRLLSLPLRVAALSWGLSTLPLTVLLRLGGRVTRLLDTCLAVVGLTRQTRAARAALATEEALRSQLRQSVARHRVRACARRKHGNARAARCPQRTLGTTKPRAVLALTRWRCMSPPQATQEQLARSEAGRTVTERELTLERCGEARAGSRPGGMRCAHTKNASHFARHPNRQSARTRSRRRARAGCAQGVCPGGRQRRAAAAAVRVVRGVRRSGVSAR